MTGWEAGRDALFLLFCAQAGRKIEGKKTWGLGPHTPSWVQASAANRASSRMIFSAAASRPAASGHSPLTSNF